MSNIVLKTRDRFDLPEGVIYLDGNSLGPLQHAVKDRVAREVAEQWGGKLIAGWNDAGWFDMPVSIGNRIAKGLAFQPHVTKQMRGQTSQFVHGEALVVPHLPPLKHGRSPPPEATRASRSRQYGGGLSRSSRRSP